MNSSPARALGAWLSAITRSSVRNVSAQWLSPRQLSIWCLSIWLFAPLAHAAEPITATAARPLSLREAVRLAQARNPDLQAFGFALRAQDARTRQAGLRPAPTLAVDLENVAGSGAISGAEAAEATFSLAQVIELGGKRAARVAAAQFEREGISVEQQAAQLDVLAEVARRFIHVATDQEQIELTLTATGLARQTLAAVEQRVTAAKSPDAELHRARITLARALVEQEHAEHELLTSRRKLAAMWGEADPRFDAVTADLYAMPALTTFTDLVARLQTNPDFLRFATEARLRDAEIRLAQSRRTPDVHVSGGIRRLEAVDEQAFVFGLSMPLFAGRQAAPAIAEAEARRGRTDAQRQAATVRAEAQLFELHQELKHAITETALLRDQVLPEMAAALRATRDAYQRGRYGYLEWVEAQREFIAIRRSLIEAAANAHNYRIEIERLTGASAAAQ